MRFLKGVTKSKSYLKEFKPDAVIGTGGYVCGPVVYAAAKWGFQRSFMSKTACPASQISFSRNMLIRWQFALKRQNRIFLLKSCVYGKPESL